jgi:hypothetical protein
LRLPHRICGTGFQSQSERLEEKALARMLVLSYSDLLIIIIKTIDLKVIGIGLAE